jgi:hypothetical protein
MGAAAEEAAEAIVIDPTLPAIPLPVEQLAQPPVILTPEQEEFYYSDISPFQEGRVLPGANSQIAMSQIRSEVGASGQCSLNDAAFRALISKSSGAQQAMSDYWGKSSELIYGENIAATGGFGSIGGGPNYDNGTTGNASRYVKGGVKNTTVNNYIDCSYWVCIPVSEPIEKETVVKLDYNFTHNWGKSRYSQSSIHAGCTDGNIGSFIPAAYSNSSNRMKDAVTLCSCGNDNGNQNIDGSSVSISAYSSKTFNASTFFTWNSSYTASSCLAFRGKIRGWNGYYTGTATINFKLTEM